MFRSRYCRGFCDNSRKTMKVGIDRGSDSCPAEIVLRNHLACPATRAGPPSRDSCWRRPGIVRRRPPVWQRFVA